MNFETLSAKEEAAFAAERHRMALRGAARLLAFLQDLMAAIAAAMLRSEGTGIGPAQRVALGLATAGLSPVSQAIQALSEQLEARGPAVAVDADAAATDRAEPAILSAMSACPAPAFQRIGQSPRARAREGPVAPAQDRLFQPATSHACNVPMSKQTGETARGRLVTRRTRAMFKPCRSTPPPPRPH